MRSSLVQKGLYLLIDHLKFKPHDTLKNPLFFFSLDYHLYFFLEPRI